MEIQQETMGSSQYLYGKTRALPSLFARFSNPGLRSSLEAKILLPGFGSKITFFVRRWLATSMSWYMGHRKQCSKTFKCLSVLKHSTIINCHSPCRQIYLKNQIAHKYNRTSFLHVFADYGCHAEIEFYIQKTYLLKNTNYIDSILYSSYPTKLLTSRVLSVLF